MQVADDSAGKFASANFLCGFFRRITVQICASLLRISLFAPEKRDNAPTLVISTN
jgi:hypothetical protein